MDDLTLGQMIFGGAIPNKTPGGSGTVSSTTTVQGIATSNSVNGEVDVLVDNQPMTVATTFAVAENDVCIITITNGSPMVTGIVGKGDIVDNTIDGTIRATTAVIMSLMVGSVNAEKIEAGEAYIKDLTAEDFSAENIEATTAKFTELYSDEAAITNLKAVHATIQTLEATKAFIEDLTAKNVTTERLVASAALIDELNAKNITVSDIDATRIYVNALEGAYANVNELVADLASVKDLDVQNLTAKLAKIDTLESTYARLDFANVEEGWIKEAYIGDGEISNAKIQKGAIHDANIADATITAAKIHDIDADTITAGTLKTERLLLVDNETGEVSIVKAINVANGVATDVASGNKIQAESIDVVDLYALQAKIGGFDIGQTHIYHTKENIEDPNSGVYIGLDGVAIGDGNVLGLTDKSPFVMKSDGTFFLGGDTDNLYFDPFTGKLSINISELKIASTNIAQAIGDLQGQVTNNATQITQNANNVAIQFGEVNENLGEIRSYISFSSSDDYGSYMELGKTDGESTGAFKTLVTDKQGLLFLENEQKVAWISNKSMHITKAEITNTLAIKNWKFEQRSNDHLTIKWREWEEA